MNSKLLEQKTEKHEMQMLICGGVLRADEDERRDLLGSIMMLQVRKIWRAISVQSFEGHGIQISCAFGLFCL